MAELFYKMEAGYWYLYILDKGQPEKIKHFDDREDMLIFIEDNYKKAILYVG